MKNINISRCLIKTIAMTADDFAELVDIITDGDQFVVDNEEGVHVEQTLGDKPFKSDYLTTKLSEYFDVQVTSWHSDNFEIPLVYICYEEPAEISTKRLKELLQNLLEWGIEVAGKSNSGDLAKALGITPAELYALDFGETDYPELYVAARGNL